MAKQKARTKGEKYRPVVTVLKTKKGRPTVLQVSGQVYVYQSPDQFRK